MTEERLTTGRAAASRNRTPEDVVTGEAVVRARLVLAAAMRRIVVEAIERGR